MESKPTPLAVRLSRVGSHLLTGTPRSGETAQIVRLRRALLATLTLLTLLIGLYRIDQVSPWPDESVTVMVMWRTWPEMFALFGGADAPLLAYYVLARLWVSIVPFLPTLVALRVLSAVACALTVTCTTALVARRVGLAPATLAGLFLAILPGVSRYAQEARPYALLMLASAASWLAWDTWRRPFSGVEARRGTGARWPRLLADAASYLASLAATALIHLFGLFQWPAQVLADLTTPSSTARERVRRAVWTIGAMLVVLLVVGVPVAVGALRGTGPAQSTPVTVAHLIGILVRTANVVQSLPRASVFFGLALLAVVLWVVGQRALRQYADLVRVAVIWLGVPLALATVTALLKPSLLRPRYWLPALPPISVLASVSLIVVARLVFTRLRDHVNRGAADRTWIAAVGALIVIVVPLAAQTVAVAAPHVTIRKQNGHGVSMTPALARLDAMLAAEPDLPVLVSPGTRTGLVAVARPELADRNALFRKDPSGTSVWPIRQTEQEVAAAMAGHDRAIWLHSTANGAPQPTSPPRVMVSAGFRLTSTEHLGSWWFSILER